MGEEKISYEFGVLSDVYEYIEEYEIVEKEEKELEEKWLS